MRRVLSRGGKILNPNVGKFCLIQVPFGPVLFYFYVVIICYCNKNCTCIVFRAANAFVYYGLSVNSTSLGGNKYLNFALVCLVEIPGYTLAWVAMNRLGRRWSLAGSLLLCSVTCMAAVFVPQGIVKLSEMEPGSDKKTCFYQKMYLVWRMWVKS
jgi:hypothetical protein